MNVMIYPQRIHSGLNTSNQGNPTPDQGQMHSRNGVAKVATPVTGAKTRAPLNHWQRLEIHDGLCALLQVAVSIDIGKRLNPKQKQEINWNLVFPNLYNRS
jgi:hypothetical protein